MTKRQTAPNVEKRRHIFKTAIITNVNETMETALDWRPARQRMNNNNRLFILFLIYLCDLCHGKF